MVDPVKSVRGFIGSVFDLREFEEMNEMNFGGLPLLTSVIRTHLGNSYKYDYSRFVNGFEERRLRVTKSPF